MTSWKERLEAQLDPAMRHEIDGYEKALDQKRSGEIEDQTFNELRLRRGAYGQRYDNGQRHDGEQTRTIPFPLADTFKGVGTYWDAPGMQRIKLPWGGMTREQMLVLADVAEEYSDAVLHITTRQDIQLHYVHIDDTPDMMRRLGAVGITTHEACGNVVRNVTACPEAGVCKSESFDVTPYAQATHEFLLGHPDAQDFGRKFKIAFSGCEGSACGLVNIHDAGAVARVKDGERGFTLYVGGGLGSVPYRAKVFDEFLPEAELLPTLQAIARVFARNGEKKNRARARLKFTIKKMGFDAFKAEVLAERPKLPHDPRWTAFLEDLGRYDDKPLKEPAQLVGEGFSEQFTRWHDTNVRPQRQEGYSMVVLALPLGDVSSHQFRKLADISHKYAGDTLRTSVEQNILMRWVRSSDLPDLHADLDAAGLAEPGAGTIIDITSCPGTDTCKLGVSSSRGLAGELRDRLAEQAYELDAAARGLRIKVSGCFNSCGQHHIADIGFWGVSRKRNNVLVPHFQVVLGGQWTENGGAFGLAMGAAPSKNIPAIVDRVTGRFVTERQGDEKFQAWVQRIGKGKVRELIEDLLEIPTFEDRPDFYSDWGDPRVYTIKDIGVGECAGEIVDTIDFDLQASEREIFQASIRLDQDDAQGAADIAYQAMLNAAKALAKTREPMLGSDPAVVIEGFKQHLFDTKLFHDPFAGGKFGSYLFRIHDEVSRKETVDDDGARRRIEEAQLFIEAAHACYGRMSQDGVL